MFSKTIFLELGRFDFQVFNYWFLETEVGAALMLESLMSRIVAVLVFMLPSNILKPPPNQTTLPKSVDATLPVRTNYNIS